MKTVTYDPKTKFATLWQDGRDMLAERCSGKAAARRFALQHNATFKEAA